MIFYNICLTLTNIFPKTNSFKTLFPDINMIRWFEKHSNISLLIVIIIAGFIFYVSSWEFAPKTPLPPNLNAILYHIGIFFLLAFFVFISLIQGRKKQWLVFAILLSLFYAVSDEFHQYFVPGRVTSFGDVFLDSVGIVFALVIYMIILEMRR